MPEENLDANTEADSSAASSVEGANSSDEMGASSTPNDTADSSQDANAGQTMADVIKSAFDKSTKSAPSAEKDDAESAVQSLNKTEEEAKADTEAEKKVEKKPDDGEEETVEGENEEVEKKEPIPYERFQEVVAKRQEFEQELAKVKPLAEYQQRIVEYCTNNSITNEQFSQALEVAALLNSDPAKALERLAPIVDSLRGFTGDKLPEDLQKDVDGGELSLARAKEIASLRAKESFGKKYTEHQQKVQQQRAEEMFRRDTTTAIAGWETAKRSADPDYKPKAGDSAPDGKWELVRDRFLSLINKQDEKGGFVHPVKTPSDMVKVMDVAYQQINATFFSLRPKSPTKHVLKRNGSSRVAEPAFEQMKDLSSVVRSVAAKAGAV